MKEFFESVNSPGGVLVMIFSLVLLTVIASILGVPVAIHLADNWATAFTTFIAGGAIGHNIKLGAKQTELETKVQTLLTESTTQTETKTKE